MKEGKRRRKTTRRERLYEDGNKKNKEARKI